MNNKMTSELETQLENETKKLLLVVFYLSLFVIILFSFGK
jgi:hypothetical protein